MPWGRGHVEHPGEPGGCGDGERRDVTHVGGLDGPGRVAWCQDGAALLDAAQPPGEPADVLVWAEDDAGPQDDRGAGEERGDGPFAASFLESVAPGVAAGVVLAIVRPGLGRAV